MFTTIRSCVNVICLESRVWLTEVSDFELVIIVGDLDETRVNGQEIVGYVGWGLECCCDVGGLSGSDGD